MKRSILVFALLLLGAIPIHADIMYKVADLGGLGGTQVGPDSLAWSINNSGQVTG
jgi:hypothetical protein